MRRTVCTVRTDGTDGRAGFLFDNTIQGRPSPFRLRKTTHYQVMEEDDFADTFGQQQCTLGRERLKRQLFLFGWPWEFQKCANHTKFEETMSKFRSDCTIFNTLKDYLGPCAELTTLLRRHVGHKPMVKQFQQSLQDIRKPSYQEDITSITRKRGRVATGTHIVEEVIGSQKSCKRLKLSCKYKRPEKGMLTTLEHHVLDGRHKYETAPVDQPSTQRGALPPNAFGYDFSSRSLPFHEVASTSQTPPFYSTNGNTFSTHHADPPMFREIKQKYDSNWNIVAEAWQGDIMDVGHRFIVQHVDEPGDRWLHAWFHFPSSTCLFWPGTVQSFTGADDSPKFFVHALEVQEPFLMACFDVSKYRCYGFTWRSYAWQVFTFGPLAKKFPVRNLPVINGRAEMVMDVVADHAFYKLTRRQWEEDCSFYCCCLEHVLCNEVLINKNALEKWSKKREIS